MGLQTFMNYGIKILKDVEACMNYGLQILMVWFGLCCLMTPGLSKDIRCHV